MPSDTIESIYDELHRQRLAEYNYTRPVPPVYSDKDLENIALYKWAIDYLEPTRLRLVMKDRNNYNPDIEKDNLVYYDSFAYENNDTSKNNVTLRRCDIDNSNSSAGVFAYTLEDHERNIDLRKVGHNNIVIIQGKKLNEHQWKNLIFGICRSDIHDIYGSIGHNLGFSGFGTGIISNETVLDFKRIASRDSISSTSPYRADPRMFASQLVRDVYEAGDVYPEKITSRNKTLKDRGNYDLSGIKNIPVGIAGMNAPLVIASKVLTDIAALIGGDIWVDEYNKAQFNFLSNKHNGVVLKGYPKSTDNPDIVSYFFSNWSCTRTTDVAQGFANKLWSNVDVITIQSTGGSSEGGSQPMFDIDIAQQLPAGINFNDISLLLQRNGAGTSDPANILTLHGHIVKDVEDTPTGEIIAYWEIPLLSIPTDRPTPVFISNIELRKGVSVADNEKTWIICYDRGNEKTNTLLWFKGKETTSRNAIRQYVDRGNNGDHNSNDGWSINENSYAFAYAAFKRTIQRVSAYDPYSIRLFGLVEKPVTVPLASDPATVDQWLHQMLIYTAKPKLVFNTGVVSIPNILLQPRSVVAVNEPRLTFSNSQDILVDLTKVSYSFDAGIEGVGSRFCSIALTGLFDYRRHFFKRQSKMFKCCPIAN